MARLPRRYRASRRGRRARKQEKAPCSGARIRPGTRAVRALGASYTRPLRVGAGQRLVTDGPYRLVRHPGYLGTLLVWLDAALASENGGVAATMALVLGRAYRTRVAAEEALLGAAFADEYPAYAAHTWRLLPFVY